MSVSIKDRDALLQQTIDLKPLQGYYHADKIANRRPLVLKRNEAVGSDVHLSKFGQPVEVADSEQLKSRPYFEITKLTVNGDHATVEFRYPPEGIAGTVRFSKAGSEWHTDSHELVEH